MTTVELGIDTLAKYPFLKEAGDYIRKLRFDISESARPENTEIVQRAKKRVIEAVQRAKVSNEIFNREIEILSFPLALVFVRATGLEHLISRYSFAEARRVESLLESEKAPVVALIFQRATGIKPDEIYGHSSDFKIPVEEYLKRSTQFHTPEWKLVNRVLEKGHVYVKKWEVIRLIREEISRLIRDRLHTIPPMKIPQQFQSIVEELVQSSPVPTDMTEEVTVTPEKYPPCMVRALELLQTGQNVPHYGRFLMATYLLSIGKSVAEITQLYPRAPDFNERITRYQVEHIAGLRGGRVRYRVPSCRTLATHNFCFRTEACDTITNPLQFGREKPQERKSKRKVARRDTRVS